MFMSTACGLFVSVFLALYQSEAKILPISQDASESSGYGDRRLAAGPVLNSANLVEMLGGGGARRLSTTDSTPRHRFPRAKRGVKNPKNYTEMFDKICKKYYNELWINWVADSNGNNKSVSGCTINVFQLTVIGGQDAERHEFPHMAMILHVKQGEKVPMCGGSLISPSFVLSAAHCESTDKSRAEWVRLGEHDTKENIGSINSNAIDYKIRRPAYVHPNYSRYTRNDDIVLFRLDKPAKLSKYIRPVCLNTDRDHPIHTAWATGWGLDTLLGDGAGFQRTFKSKTVLQKVELEIPFDTICNTILEEFKNNNKFSNKVNLDSMMCAGGTIPDEKKDTCQGDSGGPLQVNLEGLGCSYLLIGITSFGDGCAKETGIYMRVSHYIPWIENIVRYDWSRF